LYGKQRDSETHDCSDSHCDQDNLCLKVTVDKERENHQTHLRRYKINKRKHPNIDSNTVYLLKMSGSFACETSETELPENARAALSRMPRMQLDDARLPDFFRKNTVYFFTVNVFNMLAIQYKINQNSPRNYTLKLSR